ncbi:hypothetical protein [Rhodococcus sp. NPDC006774]|uniref:hypothetical protein n=1 Tax=Rhodococcus sp. NPDC006774 TaxID=3157186 RepID=UPI0033EF4373
MSQRIDLPSEQDVRRVMTEHLEDAAAAGGRATVIGLARRLGLPNATFWRHYPAIAAELRAAPVATPIATRHDDRTELLASNKRLQRDNATLTQDLTLALSVIQRLTLDNHALRKELETTSGVTSLQSRSNSANAVVGACGRKDR